MFYILTLILTRLPFWFKCVPHYIIDDDITIISSNDFYRCRETLLEFSFGTNPKLQIIEGEAFSACRKLTNINLSKCIHLTSIGNSAFSYCDHVQFLSLPANLQEIGERSFEGCSGLKFIDLSNIINLTIIHESTFVYCIKVMNLKLPLNLKSIEQNAFNSNRKLYQIDLPSSVMFIHNEAFSDCNNLTIFNINENTKLQYIGFNAFYNTNLQKFIIPKSVSNITRFGIDSYEIDNNNEYLIQEGDFLYNKDKNIMFIYNGTLDNITIPDNVKIIQDYCFYKNYYITSVQFPNSLERIGNYAFYDLYWLRSIRINTIKSIGSSAFQFLNEINIESVEIIEDFAFSCEFLKNVHISYCINMQTSCFLNCDISNIILPQNLKIIGKYAFYNNTNLKSITIPATVTHIYENAFLNCNSLETCIFESASQIEYIGPFVFEGTNISKLCFPKSLVNVSTLGIKNWKVDPNSEYLFEKDGMIYSRNYDVAFAYKGDSDIYILNPKTKIIQDYCFYCCKSIREFVCTGYLKYIGIKAFYGCGNLTSINIKSVDIIRDRALDECKNLEVMNIRFNRFIDYEYPFSDYPNLTSVGDFKSDYFLAVKDTIIDNIYEYSAQFFHAAKSHTTHLSLDSEIIFDFRDSENLKTIILKNVLLIHDGTFSNCSQLKKLYVSDKLLYFKNQDDYNFEKIYVLNNESSVIEMLVENGFPREIILSWELPLTTIDFNVYIINHLDFNYISSIIISSSSLLFLSTISSFF